MNASRLLILLVTLIAAPLALSRSGYEAQAYKIYKLERVPQSALATANCQICHVNAKGDAPWNAFGLAVGFWRGKKQAIQDVASPREGQTKSPDLKISDDTKSPTPLPASPPGSAPGQAPGCEPPVDHARGHSPPPPARTHPSARDSSSD